jgi:hypothetical protein
VKGKTKQEDLMVRYLLGELPEEEQTRVEQEFLANGDYFEQLLAIEDALYDEYVRDEMAPYERARFEQLVLSSSFQRRGAEFTREILRAILGEGAQITKNSQSRRVGIPSLRARASLSLKLAALVLAILGISLLVWILHLRTDLIHTRDEVRNIDAAAAETAKNLGHESERNRELLDQLNAERELRAQLEQKLSGPKTTLATTLVSVTLTPNTLTRSGGSATVVNMGDHVRRIRLKISLEDKDENKAFAITIRTYEGRAVWNGSDLRNDTRHSISIVLPAGTLAVGDYILTLSGGSGAGDYSIIGDYQFSVRKPRH